ncbi:variable surface protein Vir12-related [Plasmodium vivax]|uniref:Variable surface protein Vir12-related n=1 Tax=Plasmodium vivax (strain Salvador I) TaxID=126793 RepID=A5KD11_PLAVS|nr:variable surface protein Vir12-related [Plasmodium vivax]EDL42757.1 variable surface protein Vir12-related [Plasmodium vivax]|eukprot:XP_001612550.1 variable surface protein Vir12-related [Plasmodium vivax Sal-1]
MLYDDFYVKDSKSNFINECNALDNHEKTHKGVKELCMKLVSSLDKLSKMETISQERKDRCDYLSYWLYDEIGKIYNVHSSKINTVQFVKDLIGVGNEVNKKNIKNNTCTIKTDSSISLDEWKKRKYFYIYFKKHNELSSDVNRSNNYKCSKHNKYLKSIDSLYKTYYKATCTGWFFGGNTDYFKCDTNLNPNVLLPKVEKCQVSRSSSGGGGGFFGSWFGLSSSRGSTASQAGVTRQTQASASAGKAGPQAQETRAGNVGSTQDAKLAAVPRESKATPINMERQPIPEKLTGPSIEQNQQVQLQHVPNSYTGLDTLPDGSSGSSDFLKSTHEILKSEYFRHAVVGASIIGVVIFLFYFFKSTPIRSQTSRRDKKKRELENNYYDEYEEELPRYGSQQSFAESQMSEAYLPYQPRRDSYY